MKDELKISEIEEKYDGQWVVVEITKTDKYNNPRRGRVLFHGQSQDEVYGKGPEYRNAHPMVKLYYFYAGNPIPDDMGVMFVARSSYPGPNVSRRTVYPCRT